MRHPTDFNDLDGLSSMEPRTRTARASEAVLLRWAAADHARRPDQTPWRERDGERLLLLLLPCYNVTCGATFSF